ncbi:TetR/AcrR family transcriptional regulator [Pseudomonas resinovorans]|uniref:TetR/AcrR family transcriptional regulator n=1 Tax=Metapseudomonas resinovorans TaxID=53412 RepID=A0ABT4Y3L9_METRE|nr:TetR/AcrR family transcriptional regulator [Pseudomonas resinovorans]MDA8483432.1 TetR/AcrR family transcriptional regulator [Pseudomonas resinovorans]
MSRRTPVPESHEGRAGKPSLEQGVHDNVLRVALPARPRKRPRQARSIALVDALKKAGCDILETEGREALSIYRLSEYSGVAISSIYEYYPTIEALIGAIFDDYRANARLETIASIRALPQTATLYDGIEMVLSTGLASLHRWLQIDSDLSVRTAFYGELVRLEVIKPEQFWTSMVIPALVERFSDEVLVRDREKAGYLAYQAVTALPRALVIERPDYLTSSDTVRMLTRMLHALLTTTDAE